VDKNDEYRANAPGCQRMAEITRYETEKRRWLDMGQRWLIMILPSERTQGAKEPKPDSSN